MTLRPRLFSLSGIAAFALLALPASADSLLLKPKAVVELFTSQGCAQCPPADALLTSLAEADDVVALAYHVDYWDYVGWEDTFGDQVYSDRQRAYAKSWGSSRIYTPQMVINGSRASSARAAQKYMGALASASLPLDVEVRHVGDMLKISIPANTGYSNAVVWMVTYLDRADVAIDTGENAGKSMVYTQVVTDRQVLGMWEGVTGADIKLPIPEVLSETSTGIAIIVQQEKDGLPGPILGAAAFER